MAISVDWPGQDIFVPKADSVFFGTDPVTGREIRTFDTEKFHKDLRSLEETEEGRPGFPRTHDYRSATVLDGASYAPFMEIIGGYSVTFEDGTYRIVLQGTNNNIASVATINQVSVQPSNAAGLVGSQEIENQSYLNGNVFINAALGAPDNAGTPTNPVATLQDGIPIALLKNLIGYDIAGNAVIGASDNVVGKRFFAPTPVSSMIVLTDADLATSYFERINIMGSMALAQVSQASFDQCFLGGITNYWGSSNECIFVGDITVNPNATGLIYTGNGRSGIPGDQQFVWNCNGANCDYIFRDYNGGIRIRNFTQGNMSISGNDVRVVIESNCTGGQIVIGGNAWIDDQSGAGCDVVTKSKVDSLIWDKVLPTP